MERIWELAPKIPKEFKNKFPEFHPVILQLLYNRGVKTKKAIDQFLNPDYTRDIHDPFIFKDMKKAVDKIYAIVAKQGKIIICGDSDTDGACASTILFKGFKELGIRNLEVYIPDRDIEGYGLNSRVAEIFIKEKPDCVITCDCGITNVDGIAKLERHGISVVITDHHSEPEKLPPAFAIINPKVSRETYPNRFLSGTGVAFKVIQALLRDKRCNIKNKEAFEKWVLDLVAIGTITDRMILLGENRTLTTYGLIVLNKTANVGLRALIGVIDSLRPGAITARSIGYILGPRLNVSGRIGHASGSLRLLLSSDQEGADKRAKRIQDLNNKRIQLVEEALKKIIKELGPKPSHNIIFISEKDLQGGLLGLMANRLVDYYHRPTIIVNHRETGIKGSGRSVPGFNLFEALSKIGHYFIDFGGHPQAIGFNFKNIDELDDFKQDIYKIGEKELQADRLVSKLLIDTEISLDDIDWDFYEVLSKFEPFGDGNPQPYFLLKNIPLKNVTAVGRNGQHYRLLVGEDNRKMIYFNGKDRVKQVTTGDHVDIVVELSINFFNGRQELQIKVIDLKKSESIRVKG
ncbi:single-stranded-DNA-specific exonuclease RecJ [Patescibacteria group bacterium AH-259-L07]|nr:single-stranded-DNA-specific exonuclease RecJ [Patescibacteria group bacterium AH-259-L07]